MPHKDPAARAAYHRARYAADKTAWKNPDGSILRALADYLERRS